ncbi:MAG: three-Cys-motif partner protein TcmP [Methanophagales archaeon]|nr:three-Cys-motif partner protein TcmP [Methanophagales archaeon]
MSYKDSAPEKWEYREHTRVKHELLRKYLWVWTVKLGKFHRRILFFDCFAGRGDYVDKTGKVVALGSPIIALQVANNLLEHCEEKKRKTYFDEFICIAIEKDEDNFKNLQKVLAREKGKIKFKDKLLVELINDEFANVTNKILKEAGENIAPSFFFIDPFGFSGIPFETVKSILSLPRTEIFFTFMTRDINRFLAVPQVEKILDELYPIPEWRDIYKLRDWQKRDQALKDLYVECLLEIAEVKYVFPFRVCMDEKYQTLYYLIHATNHFDGLKIMKDIMHAQGASGEFAYLGPKETKYKGQLKLFDDDLSSLKKYLLDQFKGTIETFTEILKKTYMHTYFVESEYRQALKELEKEHKVRIDRVTSRTERGLSGNDRIIFPKSNPTQISLPVSIPKTDNRIKIHYKEYQQLDGKKEILVHRVNDGSIIKRFDKTPLPKRQTDVVCPHFLELKWAYGCPYDCAWCYLKGTFRFRPEGKSPVIKSYEKIELHATKFLEEVKTPEILNTGEIADSLMYENVEYPFSKFIIPIFEKQKLHKVLFLTKSSNVKHLLEIEPHNQAILSFSLNAIPVAKKWEKASSVLKRIEAAKKVFEAGYEVRIRIDPMVPIENWQEHYLKLLEVVFENLMPERITLGSLRGLQSTINGCTDKSWVKYLKESSNWGKKIDFKTRYAMYSTIIQQLENEYGFENTTLCKESLQMWEAQGMDYQKMRCNCIW